jgi:hypothetical protein
MRVVHLVIDDETRIDRDAPPLILQVDGVGVTAQPRLLLV